MKMPVPQHLRDNLLGGAIHVEAYQLGSVVILLCRENLADARQESSDYRWHLQIGHPDRIPQPSEIQAARKLAPDGIHMALAFPKSGFDVIESFGTTIHLWEVHDDNLTDQWESESVAARGDE